MCLLTVFPMPDLLDGKMIERLENGANANPHGSGWAVVTGRRIITGKSLNDDEAIESFAEAYDQATGPALFHSRWATHGSRGLSNVHPFPVRKMAHTYLAHNGIMPNESCPAKTDKRSDTRVFADDILPIRYGHLDSPATRAALSHWLSGNKIAILTTNPRFSRNVYLFGQRAGEWVDGVWFSNNDHEGYDWKKYLREWDTEKKASGEHADTDCIWCHGEGVVNEYDVCEVCGTCQDCYEPYRECSCYTPASARPYLLTPSEARGIVG